jgi:hypothetical protein
MTPAERKAEERAKKIDDAALKKLITEQRIDENTGGRGRGMFLSQAEAGRGAIITGWRDVGFENTVALASEGARLDLEQFGGKRTERRDARKPSQNSGGEDCGIRGRTNRLQRESAPAISVQSRPGGLERGLSGPKLSRISVLNANARRGTISPGRRHSGFYHEDLLTCRK